MVRGQLEAREGNLSDRAGADTHALRLDAFLVKSIVEQAEDDALGRSQGAVGSGGDALQEGREHQTAGADGDAFEEFSTRYHESAWLLEDEWSIGRG